MERQRGKKGRKETKKRDAEREEAEMKELIERMTVFITFEKSKNRSFPGAALGGNWHHEC